jgi:hypothetical protein
VVTDAIVDVLAGFLAWVLDSMPDLAIPTFVTGTGEGTLSGTIASAVGAINGFGVYLPGSQIGGATALVLAGIIVGLAVKVVRIVASFLTAGGGSAA